MPRLSRLARKVHILGARLSDWDAWLSLDPARVARRQLNKQIAKRVVGPIFDLANGLFLKVRRKK